MDDGDEFQSVSTDRYDTSLVSTGPGTDPFAAQMLCRIVAGQQGQHQFEDEQ